MKKVMTLALCLAAVGTMGAQKANVDAAKKLSGKFDKIGEARSTIKKAMEDPSTANEANTYFVAGKIEYDAYDKGLQQSMINPDDASANPVTMAEELLNGYDYFLKALPLDSVPNEKGEVKPKFSKDILGKLAGHHSDYFKGGAAMYESQKYYPEAYRSFLIYADMPDYAWMGNKAPQASDADRAQAYFYAGLSAYSGNEVLKAADAFRAARKHGSDDPNAYIYEIACWQNLTQNDTTLIQEAQDRIFEVASDGYQKFGLEQPVFLNNLVNTLVQDGKYDEALQKVADLQAQHPESSNLYGLQGFIYDRKDDDASSIAAYKKAIALQDCDYETLKNAAKKLYRVGTAELEKATNANDAAAKAQVKSEYFDTAYEVCQRAKAQKSDDGDLQYVLDSIEYALQTYF